MPPPHAPRRRELLALASAWGAALWLPRQAHAGEAHQAGRADDAATPDRPSRNAPPASAAPLIRAGTPLRFPQDFGAHPAYRTEWWYITGQLQPQAQTQTASSNTPASPPGYGFQITFFRTRVDAARTSHSAFATHQLVFAHAALTDLQQGRLLHDQRIARAGFDLADAAVGDTRVKLRDWQLQRSGPAAQSRYTSHVAARDFTLDLAFTQTQPVLLQGEAGFSRKGPNPINASHYYSQPHLAVQGQLQHHGHTQAVQGQAWLDHEWGETLLDPAAVGWDWIGMNLHDGSALTAFRLRRQDGSTLWAGGSLRRPGQATRAFQPDEVRFTPQRIWASPATGARYPVQWQIDVAGTRYQVRPRLDQQELDSRQSTGGVYWEGLSDLLDAQGRVIGQGYLEMTGYVSPMSL
ncbi:hydrolase [Aquabacterium sp. NJ1]|uniref:lipocalin-like domain-containing protein n=1 Tax=Aquabacterium sp. NJ1 TaxID=1538295 RepID=UPI00052CA3C9|nr:carotenoid 1,2-hydratase [Aquabacterium sp. NJ1]KGM40474.1 hydrolase [Aquabacterium sp. NJ1]